MSSPQLHEVMLVWEPGLCSKFMWSRLRKSLRHGGEIISAVASQR